MPSVLFVFTSVNKTPAGSPTGWFLPEAAHPYYILAQHATIDFAAVEGPNPPIFEQSIELFSEDKVCIRFLNNNSIKAKLANAKKLTEVNAQDYDAIYYVGGHGPSFDLYKDSTNIKLASQFYQAGKVIGATCHGPAALLRVTDASGKPIIGGRTLTAFSNEEEELVGMTNNIPFTLEDKIPELGGKYEKATEPWGAKVVVDGNLITGQNPGSSVPLAEEMLKALQK
ncbi:hypothetical protein AMATHDRAFT_148332 [Amanita thiersii Skay4041]|uniref:D-lactate dehydratase n=1 Tax=Amanita thiersii Skay4041 TaxID=703135 RepID=A0A2A9NDN1_9AGAR|nr:hypothetical protein AMATHDRAFT_148332 [Amanita thiersii Skay4041]